MIPQALKVSHSVLLATVLSLGLLACGESATGPAQPSDSGLSPSSGPEPASASPGGASSGIGSQAEIRIVIDRVEGGQTVRPASAELLGEVRLDGRLLGRGEYAFEAGVLTISPDQQAASAPVSIQPDSNQPD